MNGPSFIVSAEAGSDEGKQGGFKKGRVENNSRRDYVKRGRRGNKHIPLRCVSVCIRA